MEINKRMKFGRRKSDWLIPLGFLTVGVIAAFWASYNRTKKSDLERQKEALELQIRNYERIVDTYEKRQAANAASADATRSAPKPTRTDNTSATENAASSNSTANVEKPQPSDKTAQVVRTVPTVTIGAAPPGSTPGAGRVSPGGNAPGTTGASAANGAPGKTGTSTANNAASVNSANSSTTVSTNAANGTTPATR